ncbi:glycoside hydrolase family 28 protein [Agrobacterium tumefaciens]|uniref:polygalacturonase PglA n=1 Tax=Agrobacterium tumefaciens TaxID=358 RepID=UPI00157330B2|nr:glycoside hydrolase family 28 protein [Agrobacterium tumefaciens]NSZ64451.1 glycoside hydrolase family 28 protein [Agrobacterium tumefaciens]NTA70821.1 glycoside hydrolase family 28 protein [Agrobacterium tumefaciens]WIE40920.1 glycoside hydrolase family 28 protein [Agrobacterium tumefaciens]
MNEPSIIALSARTAVLCLAVPGARYHLPQTAWRLTSQDGDLRTGKTATVVTLLHDLRPDTRYVFEADGFASLEFRTAPCAGLVEATAFSLKPDIALDDEAGARANARALEEAVAAVPVGGTLRLAAGLWTAFPVRLKSDMTFHLAEGALLRAPSTRNGWSILPARDEAGRMLGSWEGLPDACFAAPVHAIGADNLVIEGGGVLDGSGDRGDWWSWPKETRNGARRPRGLHLVSCRNVGLFGFTIRNAPSWTVHPQGCEALIAAGLTISAPHNSPNTDGFNPESCRNVTISGVRFSVGDDCIAVKAGKRGPNGEDDHLAETRGVSVRHCLMERGHGGLVIGSEMSGGVHDVTVEDCDMVGTDRGLRLKTRRGRGGSVSNITMRRVLLDGVHTALSANAHYHCDADGHDGWVQSRDRAPVDDGTPFIDGITVEDVEIRHLAHAAGVFLGLPEAPIRNIAIRNLTIVSRDPAAVATPPIMADGVRPMLHEGIVFEQAEIICDDPALLSASTVSHSQISIEKTHESH